MREGKHHMEVRRVNDFFPAFVHPDFPGEGLAVGAVAVAAGIMMEFCMSAVATDADVAAKSARLAGHQIVCGFALDIRLESAAAAVAVVGKAECLPDREISQWFHLPTGQRGLQTRACRRRTMQCKCRWN